MPPKLVLDGSQIDLATFVALTDGPVRIAVSDAVFEKLAQARATVDRYTAGDVPVYGLNTGLGANLGHRIDETEIAGFQAQLLEGRMAGVGDPLPERVSRGALLGRLIGASKGGSGLSIETFQAMVTLAEHGMAPVLPSRGSIGAGDLVLAAHFGGVLIGRGEVWTGGEKTPAKDALANAGLQQLSLKPKDALALANHSTITCSFAALTAARAEEAVATGMAVAALSGEGYGMNLSIFDERLNALRPASGQCGAAAWFRRAFHGSSLEAPESARSIQDALSFRTMAPTFGAARSTLTGLINEIECELNGIADNPVILSQGFDDPEMTSEAKSQLGEMLSTPNFHTPALATGLDSLAIALAQLANASAQRIVKLMMPDLTGLPKYLSPVGGASAGFVPVQKTVAALLADIRRYTHPASIDAMPVSDGVEDVAPQTMLSAVKLEKQLHEISYLTAIEAMVAAQAVDLRKPACLGGTGQTIFDAVRQSVPLLDHDRPIGNDIEIIRSALDRSHPRS